MQKCHCFWDRDGKCEIGKDNFDGKCDNQTTRINALTGGRIEPLAASPMSPEERLRVHVACFDREEE